MCNDVSIFRYITLAITMLLQERTPVVPYPTRIGMTGGPAWNQVVFALICYLSYVRMYYYALCLQVHACLYSVHLHPHSYIGLSLAHLGVV